mgnify:FL=1
MEEELRAVLSAHGARYPAMEPQDVVKLVYQNEFGGGHLVTDPAQSLERLRAEHAAVPRAPGAPLAEDIGNGLARVMLGAVEEREYPLEALNRDFARSAALHRGDMDRFRQKLEVLRQMAWEGAFGFSLQALEDYLGPYLASGCPPVSHSVSYRAAYHPAYRVVLRCACLPLLAREAEALAAGLGRAVVALDGRCASGKTTLAARLARERGWSVVHMDHFFLRPEQRTPQRYAQPGGNVDHERFLEEVLLPLRRGERPVYRPFDCHAQALRPPIALEPGPVVLVEGSYACHPALWEHYDLRAFLTVNPALQLERIRAREGEEQARTFQERWIPLEERYFSACGVEARCDYRLEV